MSLFAFIVTASILLISVPLVFASPDVLSSKKNLVFYGIWYILFLFDWMSLSGRYSTFSHIFNL